MKNTKTFTLKNNKIDFCILTKNNKDNNFIIVAVKDSKQLGFCHFYFENNICKISRIAVTEKEYLNFGIGSVMFKAMENFAFKNNVKEISGIFIPRGYDNAYELTSKFYKNQNMTTFNLDFDYCEREEISKYLKSADETYDLPVVENEKLYKKVSDYNYETHDIFSSKNQNEKSDTISLNL